MRIINLLVVAAFLILSCSKPEARKPIVRKTSSFMNESIERNKILTQVENELLQKKMEIDSTREYVNSEQGFWYSYDLKKGADAPMPGPGDAVVFNYEILDLKDEVVFSKEELGPVSYRVDKEELITGLQDGIKLMREGEKVTFLFPSYKAYGYSGSERVEPNQPLIYKVELVTIEKQKE